MSQISKNTKKNNNKKKTKTTENDTERMEGKKLFF